MRFVQRIWILPIFSFGSVLLFIMGMTAVYLMNKKAFDNLNSVNEIYVPVVTAMAEVRVELNTLKDIFQQMALSNETDIKESVEATGNSISRKLKLIADAMPDQVAITELPELFNRYYHKTLQLTESLRHRRLDELNVEINEVVFHRAHLEEHMTGLSQHVDRLYRDNVENTQHKFNQLAVIIFVMIIFLTSVIAVGSFIVMNNISNRFNTLVAFANEIKDGNYGKQFSSPWNDEFSTVVNAFNLMTQSIKDSTDKLNRLANYDALTEVNNRSSLLARLRAEVGAVRRHGYSLCYCMCDIDRFKFVNDNYGHLIGDEVIKTFAQIMTETLRTEDVIGRYGGDEFGIILPHTSLAEAEAALDRVRHKLETHIFTNESKQEFTVTGSFGIAQYTNDMDEKIFVRFADDALYTAKQKGRNCVAIVKADSNTIEKT